MSFTRGAGVEAHRFFLPVGVERRGAVCGRIERGQCLVHLFGARWPRGQGLDGAQHRGVAAVARLEFRRYGGDHVRGLGEHRAGGALGELREEFQIKRQVVGQLARGDLQAVQGVERGQPHHRLAAVARFAVHVLVKVQRQRAVAVEQRDVAFLGVEQRQGAQLGDERVDRREPVRRQQAIGAQCFGQFIQRRHRFGGGIAQQRRQGA